MHMNPPSVRAVIVNESQAQEIAENHDLASTSHSIAHRFDQVIIYVCSDPIICSY